MLHFEGQDFSWDALIMMSTLFKNHFGSLNLHVDRYEVRWPRHIKEDTKEDSKRPGKTRQLRITGLTSPFAFPFTGHITFANPFPSLNPKGLL
jgi:hypothetical protein